MILVKKLFRFYQFSIDVKIHFRNSDGTKDENLIQTTDINTQSATEEHDKNFLWNLVLY